MTGVVAPARRRPVLAGPAWPVLVVIGVAAAVVAALGVRYAGEDYPRWLDELGLMLGRRWFPLPRGWAMAVIGLFDPVPLAVLILVLAGACLALRRRRLAVVAVVGPVLTGGVATALKPLVDRTKNGDLAYPSGHMSAAFALALVAGLLLASVIDAPRWLSRAMMVLVPAVGGGVVGLAMTVASYHYLTDVVGGCCVAVAVVLSVALVADRWPPHRRARTGEVGETESVAVT